MLCTELKTLTKLVPADRENYTGGFQPAILEGWGLGRKTEKAAHPKLKSGGAAEHPVLDRRFGMGGPGRRHVL